MAFCIHNIAYQGRFAFSDFSLLNLPDQFKGSFDFIDGYEFFTYTFPIFVITDALFTDPWARLPNCVSLISQI